MVLMRDFEALEQSAIARDIPIMQKEGILFLINLLNKNKAQSLLEVGTAIGYSSMMMADHVDRLSIDTIERDPERYDEACRHVADFQLDDRIALHFGDALTFNLEELRYQPYDALFIDGAKAQYQRFFERYVDLVKEDGFILVDNLDFHGMIFDIPHIKNRNTRALVRKIKRFKDWIFAHDAYEAKYYDIGDGLCVITRKK